MSPATRGRRQGAPAAALLSPDKPAPTVIDAAADAIEEEAPVDRPISQTSREDHEALQRELREHQAWLASMADTTPGQMLEAEQAAQPQDEAPEDAETPEQKMVRLHQECLERYWLDVAAMKDGEPVYVVGLRPPRPQCYGIVLDLGDVVPGAALWPRLESWVRAGVIVPEAQGVKRSA